MLDIKLDLKAEQVDVDISIKLDDIALDGGVYMFLLDEIPLYIGEANILLSRLTYHLYELKNNKSYFGLEDLEGKHNITYIILADKLPYAKIKKDENSKRATDKNRITRVGIQNSFIAEYRPMTQNPKIYDDEELNKLRAHRKDSMIQDGKTKNKIIKEILNNKKYYSEIIGKIKNKEYQEKVVNFNNKNG
jgi:hypothetical protein